jgi:hypothetical protein
MALGLTAQVGCSGSTAKTHAQPEPTPPPVIVVVAPVINLSGATDVDTLKLTDWVAAEFLEFPNVAVVPVNMTLAALVRQGRDRVESPEDARALAAELGADAAVVVAITEYEPYDPPRVGLIMQWYAAGSSAAGLTPASAPADVRLVADGGAPMFQVQRGYDAAQGSVRRDVKDYARQRDGAASPYGWERYVKSQELYFRYCSWSTIRTMLAVQAQYVWSPRPIEAD